MTAVEKATLKLKIKIASHTTEMIENICLSLGGGILKEEARMVRAYCLEEYECRLGENAVDELMIIMGM